MARLFACLFGPDIHPANSSYRNSSSCRSSRCVCRPPASLLAPLPPPLQALRQRLATHRRPSNFGKQLVAWYVVLPPGADRKVLQGRLIRSAERLGLMMASNRDAAMARKK